MVICIIHHHNHQSSLLQSYSYSNPQTRPPLSPNSYTFLGGRPLVHRAGENREIEPPPLCKKSSHHPTYIPIFLPSHIPHPIPSSSQPSHKKSKSSQIMLLSSIISFSNDAAAIEKTLRGIQGLATIAIGFYQQSQHTQIQQEQIQGQMIQEHVEMWIKLRGELALGM